VKSAVGLDAFHFANNRHLTDLSSIKILLQNIDAMKIENDDDVQSEGDPIAVSTVEVYVPSVKVESEVSFVFR
jgi:hypothetical protein